MKKVEIAMFIIEKIGKNSVNHQRILKGMEYFMCEMKSFITIIDLFGCLRCLKTVLHRSNKRQRYTESDDIQFKAKILQGENILKEFKMEEPVGIKPETHSAFLIKLLETMKPDEDVIISVDPEYIIEDMKEEDHPLYKDMDKSKNLDFHITLEKVHVIHDIFADNSLLVKKWAESFTTAQAESSSRMYFDYKIFIGDAEIYKSQDFLRINENNLESTEYVEELDCKKYFIDEFELSKGMMLCLKDMKKNEEVELRINNMRYFKYGDDYKEVKSYLRKKSQRITKDLKLVYRIRMYNFTQNINTFTMSFDTKVIVANRKKDLATKYIKEGFYKKAKNVCPLVKNC